MHTLRRIAHSPAPARVRAWHVEVLAVVALAGGLLGQLTGAY